jgi:dihydrodipicolinate synthase/N-acetylneuraminate lyase
MAHPSLPPDVAALLAEGTVIPAHPLALTVDRTLDERRQRALTRYYIAAGSGGTAVAVHTTQFEIHDPKVGLYEPVLSIAAEEFAAAARPGATPFIRVAGVAGPTAQAVAEAEIARALGYHVVLLSPPRPQPGDPIAANPTRFEEYMLDRARAVGEVLPVIGFYLQSAIRGPVFSVDFLRRLASIESVVAIKAAPFNRYRTLDVVRAVAESGRSGEVTLYTGNDDAIISDLVSEFTFEVDGVPVTQHIRGGLLGQWSVWTRKAVHTLAQAKRAREGDRAALADLVAKAADLTDANAALFDPSHDFAGCIAGVHEVLRRQGLLEGIWCLNPDETLSPGQADEIDRVIRTHPWLTDDDFVAEHLDDWLR